ncbi:ABC transporter substrate-binding protein [Streptomyces pseudovenezuelae]|uniref:ABC-type branched-subunit amino acid transport system substrate-binding protein n=1 Tax=Streptomyces pseudovenezuelae TaxID=67350 RepID=A0ABT6LPS5_9ACTN|nr:ABC transporter substrate-binding protein [Streptomyces pseudovenezuelae]MDH6218318.1 ABC-type branched-subunit amino acid transport system substrate-binding protein [Streptomyces pseudovenezuelae]
MTGSRRNRSTFLPRFTGTGARTARAAGALVACASLAAGCGAIPGTAGAGGDDSITVMTWAPSDTKATNKPGMPAFAQAYARWINAQGGINGRKLKVITCNEHNDSVAAAKCARIAVKRNVVAVVGSYSQYGDSYLPTLEGAGIPYIGGYGITNAEFTSPLSYPVNGGQPALLAGLGKELAAGCGPVVLVRPDTIAGDELPAMLDSGLTWNKHAAAIDQRAADDTTEYSTPAERSLTSASDDPEKKGCVIPTLGDRTGTFMDSFRRSRDQYPKVSTAATLGNVDQTVINESGGASSPYEGSYITGWYPAATDPLWDPMKKVVSEQAFGDNRIDAADAGVQTTWIAYTVLKAAITSLDGGEVTAETVRRALNNGLKVETGGLTPTLKWGFQGKLATIGFSRMVNADVTLQVVRKGRLVAARKGFLDVTKTLQTAEVN